MGTSIKSSFDSLVRASNDVKTKSGEYKQLFDDLKRIASDIQQANWQGIDSTAFVEAVNNFETEIRKMESLMNEYSTYLNEVKVEYETTQKQLETEAKSLNR